VTYEEVELSGVRVGLLELFQIRQNAFVVLGS
jgi:hypothetical protein